jgi:hypothetical protein
MADPKGFEPLIFAFGWLLSTKISELLQEFSGLLSRMSAF